LHPSQTVPSTPSLQYVAPPLGAAQTPSAAPVALLQMPPQQSPGLAQASPFWIQYEDSAQVPLVPQSLEQHSPDAPHLLPVDLQMVVSALHIPLVQSPLQQELPLVHACPSDVHCVALHIPLVQLNVAQSVFALQPPPG
jgi:hypothetical protein